jgi:hypothetical protein
MMDGHSENFDLFNPYPYSPVTAELIPPSRRRQTSRLSWADCRNWQSVRLQLLVLAGLPRTSLLNVWGVIVTLSSPARLS